MPGNHYSGEAIVLEAYPSGKGRRICFFTPLSGCITVSIQGEPGPGSSLAGCGEYLSVQQIKAFSQGNWYILTMSKKIHSPRFGGNMLHYCLSALFSELIAGDLREPCPDLYSAFRNFILLESGVPVLPRALHLLAALIQVAGWQPELDCCTICGKSLYDNDQAVLSPANGGLVCGSCTPEQNTAEKHLPCSCFNPWTAICSTTAIEDCDKISSSAEGSSLLLREILHYYSYLRDRKPASLDMVLKQL
ncbi:MAG: DNA repair protein RecO C-terminal domain-containing protein [Candidatus Wallbacteria bacterium]|nr:DNA repair protein RecO C-terminal domain-containing protein [Candidatus Wallbacteria bacterium]